MGTLVSYRLRDSVATITMDDGKVNVLSRPLLGELGAALDRAAADRAVVVLAVHALLAGLGPASEVHLGEP